MSDKPLFTIGDKIRWIGGKNVYLIVAVYTDSYDLLATAGPNKGAKYCTHPFELTHGHVKLITPLMELL